MLEPYARDTFTISIDELTGDWSGWTFKGDIRLTRSATGTLVSAFTVDTSSLVSDGVVTFTVSAATMQSKTIPTDPWWCDLRAVRTSDGFQATLFQDSVMPKANVTP